MRERSVTARPARRCDTTVNGVGDDARRGAPRRVWLVLWLCCGLLPVWAGAEDTEIGGADAWPDVQPFTWQTPERESGWPNEDYIYPAPVREREPDPEWRAAAAARIERLRQAELRIRVETAAGVPVAGAQVTVSMRRHEFGFGSAVAAEFLVGDGPDVPKYRTMVCRLFNKVTIESDLKWPHWEDLENRELALAALEWLRAQGLPVRGHCLVWAGYSWLPADVPGLLSNPAALGKRVTDHLLEETAKLSGKLVEWDVVNEPGWYHLLTDVLGRDSMVGWYTLVHSLDPDAALYINEYGVISGSSHSADSGQASYAETIRFLLDRGAPLHGIGVQGHFSWALPAPSSILSGLDRLAEFGLPIQVTEFDIDLADEALQAEYMRDVMTAFFSHPAVNGVILWGFWAGRHWRPLSALYRLDWSLKPCGEVWRDLVFREWWTEAKGTTDSTGCMVVQGFRGEYDIEVRGGVFCRRLGTVLPKGGRVLNVRLDEGDSR